MELKTTIAIKDLPAGLVRAIRYLSPKGRDVTIEARGTAHVSTNSQSYTCANALVYDIDHAATVVERSGVWGGNNGFNKPPLDRAWDPVFDDQSREVPLGGAIVVGTIGRYCSVYVHPTTYAERWIKHDVVRDAVLEGRFEEAATLQSEANPITDEECAVLYAHHYYKSGEYRKRVVARYSAALETCIANGWIKRSVNGACTITVAGKSLEQAFRESLAWKV
jgi:hypothetical protein